MWKLLFSIFLFIIGGFLPSRCLSQTKILVAVVDFSVPGSIPNSKAISLSDIVNSEMIETGRYIIVDRRNTKAIMNEMAIQMTGATSQEQVVEIGKLLNVQKIVSGNISKLGSKFVISLSLTDVESGKLERTLTRSYMGSMEGLDKPIIFITRQFIGEDPGLRKGTFIFTTSNPEGAKMYLNERFVGNSPIKIPIDAGMEYEIQIRMTNYKSWTQKVIAEEGEIMFVNAVLPEISGFRFILKRDGPLLLGTSSIIAGVAFRFRANDVYEDHQNAESLKDWRKSWNSTKRNDRLSYLSAGMATISLGYSLYEFLTPEKVANSRGLRKFRVYLAPQSGFTLVASF